MSWPYTPLGNLVDIKGGGTPSRADESYWNGGIPWATVKDFKSGILFKTEENISELGVKVSATNIIPAGTIIIPTRMALGKVAIAGTSIAINQDLKALSLKTKKITTEYLFWFLRSSAEEFDRAGKGATVKGITLDFLKLVPVPLPPLATQQHIARVLEQADQLRKQAQQMESELNQLAQSLFLEMFGDPIGNPKNWAVRPLGEIVTNLDGRRVPVKSSDRADKQGSHPYYGASGIIDYVDDFIFDERALLVAEDGANLLMRSTPIAFIAEGKYWVNNHAHVLSENGLARLEYIEYSLNLRDVSPYISGSAQPKLNQAMLNSIKVQCPPIELQDKFTDVLARIRSEKSALLENQKMIEQMFDSLMQRAFNGELTAPERKAA